MILLALIGQLMDLGTFVVMMDVHGPAAELNKVAASDPVLAIGGKISLMVALLAWPFAVGRYNALVLGLGGLIGIVGAWSNVMAI